MRIRLGACGQERREPVLAMPGGSVPEIVKDGVSGYVCTTVREMTKRAGDLNIDPVTVRHYVEENFSIEKMVRQYKALYQEAVQESK